MSEKEKERDKKQGRSQDKKHQQMRGAVVNQASAATREKRKPAQRGEDMPLKVQRGDKK